MTIRVIAISDTHNQHESIELPEGDLLIHAGDSTNRGSKEEIAKFSLWFRAQPHAFKVCISGNHDWLFENSPYIAQNVFYGNVSKQEANAKGLFYLQDSGAEIDVRGQKLKIYGSPQTPAFCNWAFNNTDDQLEAAWSLIPSDLDIIITHGPVHMILDETSSGKHAGCMKLRLALHDKKPKLHISGHIHEGYGVETWNGTTFANVSTCNLRYQPLNKPMVFDIEDNGTITRILP